MTSYLHSKHIRFEIRFACLILFDTKVGLNRRLLCTFVEIIFSMLISLGRARRLRKLAATPQSSPWSISIPRNLLYTRSRPSRTSRRWKLQNRKPAHQSRQRCPLLVLHRSPSNGAKQRRNNMGRHPGLSIHRSEASVLWYMHKGSWRQQ